MRLLLLSAALLASPQAREETIAIKGGRILTVTKGDLEDAVILVRGGKISNLGKDVTIPADARVIELPKGSVVVPGFIDAHSHLGSAFEVEESTESVTPEVRGVEAFSSDHADVKAALSSGVTLVAIAPGNGNLVGGRIGLVRLNGRRYDQMLVTGAGAMKLSLGPEALRSDREPTSRQGAMNLLRKLLRDARSEVARELTQRPALIHASTPEDIERVAEIATAFSLKATLVHGEGALEALDAVRNARLSVAFGPVRVSDRKEKLQTPAKLAKAGVKIAFVSNAPDTSEADLRAAAAIAVRHGLDRETALKALTLHPAQMLGVDDRFGSIEAGKAADLVVYGGDPLSLASGVEMVMVEGRIVHQKPK
jgi:imidazolonepropionase-like amidohydrolase